MGYQPSLDGIRAIAVVAVLLYHADVRWLPGGFLGVDVFFVVSGYLITSLLVEERRGSMTTDLKRFWLRRAKRLLPALFAMLAVTCAYAAVAVPDALYRLRTDVLAAATYSTNWWLIASKQSYFEALGRPPLLRHLWSLAVEEQWYLLWPLVFVLAMGLVRGRTERLVVPIVLVALASTVWMAIVFDPSGDASRAYFGTDTRASGLLIGAAAAMVWTPWRWPWADRRRLAGLDAIGWLALLSLVAVMLQWGPDDEPCSTAAASCWSPCCRSWCVAVSVHPGATDLPGRALAGAAALAGVAELRAVPVALARLHGDPPAGLPGHGRPDPLRAAAGADVRADGARASGSSSGRCATGRRCSGSPTGGPDRARRSRARWWAAVGATAALLSVAFVGARVATADPVDVTTGGSEEVFQPATAALSPLAPVAAAGASPSTVSAERARARPSPAPCRPTCPGGSSSWATRRPAPWSRTRPPGLGSHAGARERRGRGLWPVRPRHHPHDRGLPPFVRQLPGLAGQVGGLGAAQQGRHRPRRHRGLGRVRPRPGLGRARLRLAGPRRLPPGAAAARDRRGSSRRAARSHCSRCPATTPSTAEASRRYPSGAIAGAPTT